MQSQHLPNDYSYLKDISDAARDENNEKLEQILSNIPGDSSQKNAEVLRSLAYGYFHNNDLSVGFGFLFKVKERFPSYFGNILDFLGFTLTQEGCYKNVSKIIKVMSDNDGEDDYSEDLDGLSNGILKSFFKKINLSGMENLFANPTKDVDGFIKILTDVAAYLIDVERIAEFHALSELIENAFPSHTPAFICETIYRLARKGYTKEAYDYLTKFFKLYSKLYSQEGFQNPELTIDIVEKMKKGFVDGDNEQEAESLTGALKFIIFDSSYLSPLRIMLGKPMPKPTSTLMMSSLLNLKDAFERAGEQKEADDLMQTITLPASQAQALLVDVVALSQQKCKLPIAAKLRFATPKNFTGKRVDGYELEDPKSLCLTTKKTAEALCDAQNYFNEHGLGLYIYDAYRPKRAVTNFWNWSTRFFDKETRKDKHYPLIDKLSFFNLGYVKEDSTHCYGNTLDTELIDLVTERPLFMGARISYIGNISHSTATAKDIAEEWQHLKDVNQFADIKKQFKRSTGKEWDEKQENSYIELALKNRKTLAAGMQKFNFAPYEKEWWHYAYKNKESDIAMDLPITSDLKGLGVR